MKSSAAAGAGALALGNASSAAGQSMVDEVCNSDYGTIPVGQGDNWVLMDNRWGMDDAHQCIRSYDDGSYGYEFDAQGATCGDSCINYPEVYCGGRPWGSDSGIPELPTRRGDVNELILEWDVDINIPAGEWDFAEEWWLMSNEPNPDASPDYEIMLVMDWGGGHGHYMERANAFDDQFGNQFDHWADYSSGGTDANFHIFRLSQGQQSGKVDLTAIIDYLDQNYGVDDNLIMTGIEVGNEYWQGAYGDVTYNQLDLTVNGSHYPSGSGGGGTQPPSAPGNVSVDGTTTSSIDVSWSSVSDADEYDVFVDGGYETTTTSTSTTVTGLASGSQYTIGVEAVNDAGSSNRTQTTGTTDTQVSECDGAAGGSATVDGQTVCDVDGDGYYRDVNGDSDVTQADVTNFFEVQHRSAWKNSMFDFDGSGSVSHGDVVQLFEDTAT